MCVYIKRERERVLSVRERSRGENALCVRVTTDILNHHHRPRGEEGLCLLCTTKLLDCFFRACLSPQQHLK
jgi:hypothetical protein